MQKSRMVLALCSGLMEPNMKGNLEEINLMEMEERSSLMENSTLGNLQKARPMGMECSKT
jgi:hypothetical protein